LNEVLVDTDVVSCLLNRHSLAGVYERLLAGREPMISFMTVAEMYRGALKRNWGPRRILELAEHLRQFAIVPRPRLSQVAFLSPPITNATSRVSRA
jgi:tRNA(fMet)-specific endonuclease VapC